MTNPYTIPDIDIGPSPIQLPQEPPTVHMSEPQPSTSNPNPALEMSNNQLLALLTTSIPRWKPGITWNNKHTNNEEKRKEVGLQVEN